MVKEDVTDVVRANFRRTFNAWQKVISESIRESNKNIKTVKETKLTEEISVERIPYKSQILYRKEIAHL